MIELSWWAIVCDVVAQHLCVTGRNSPIQEGGLGEPRCYGKWEKEGILPTKLMSKIRLEEEKVPFSLILIRIRKGPYTVTVFPYMGSIGASMEAVKGQFPADMIPTWVCLATYCWWWFVLDSFSPTAPNRICGSYERNPHLAALKSVTKIFCLPLSFCDTQIYTSAPPSSSSSSFLAANTSTVPVTYS